MFLEKLDEIQKKYDELTRLLSDPEVFSDYSKSREYSKEQSDLAGIVDKYNEYKKILSGINEAEEILTSGEEEGLKELAALELEELNSKKLVIEDELKLLLIPADPLDSKNIILEIRAGTGGDEASLFAADLFKMYNKYAGRKKWKIEIMGWSPTGLGGFKEAVASVQGKGVYSCMKYERGTHRVQRGPSTQ